MIDKAKGFESYPVLKLAQYLTGLTIHQDALVEIGKALVTFFNSDLVAFGERCAADVVCRHWTLSDRVANRTWPDPIITEAVTEVLESGFLSTRQFFAPEPFSVLFLPIIHENLVTAVMLVGYQISEPFPKELLEVLLAVSGLVGTTTSRLASEKELREYRLNLEELVKKRTSELTEANEKLHIEIVHRKRAEAIMQARLRLSEYAHTHSLNELLTRTLDEAETLTGSTIGFFHYLQADQQTFTMQTWSTNTLLSMRTAEGTPQHYPVEAAGVWADCVRQRQAIIHNDHASLPNCKGMPQGHAVVVRELVMPILRGDLIVGVIGVGNKPANYVEQDIEAVSQLANMAWDIVVGKRAEEEKLVLEQQLLQTQKLESLGVLAGGIAHDFNNILMAIMGNADLALMRINKESPAVDNLRRIEQSAARAADLAQQMLAYSGKGKFVVENVNMSSLVDEMLNMMEVSISKMAVLRFDLTSPIPSVEADATQLRQVIMNLVINASEAIGDKSGVIAITTGCMECDKNYLNNVWLNENLGAGLYVSLEISDTGCGMDSDTLAKLFDPFFTTKFTGRGLGMAAVLGIVRGHKGAIRVYSEPDKGSSFKILLPAVDRPSEMFNGHTQIDDWKGKGTVLLVDDEETVRAIGSEMLRELGFQVVTAEDGRVAVEVFKTKNDIDLVILDLTMPHVGGEQCFRELRLLNPELKVIMSSGFNQQEVTQLFVGKGLSGFIQKPYKLSVLRETLQKI